jgi:hypothetical protein
MTRALFPLAFPLAGAALLVLAGCHLADELTQPQCEAGTHADNGQCDLDILDGPTIAISAGASCDVSPASITVEPNGSFRFMNDDSIDHVITGADGMTWATAFANQASPYIGITRSGSWPYTVSGCSGIGVVVVQ